jgi:hypothetical protein
MGSGFDGYAGLAGSDVLERSAEQAAPTSTSAATTPPVTTSSPRSLLFAGFVDENGRGRSWSSRSRSCGERSETRWMIERSTPRNTATSAPSPDRRCDCSTPPEAPAPLRTRRRSTPLRAPARARAPTGSSSRLQNREPRSAPPVRGRRAGDGPKHRRGARVPPRGSPRSPAGARTRNRRSPDGRAPARAPPTGPRRPQRHSTARRPRRRSAARR